MNFRFAEEKDLPIIQKLVLELARYEKMEDQVTATIEDYRKSLFEEKIAEVLFVEEGDSIRGMALFFHNYSTFLGKKGLYLEDLYIRKTHRKKGYGKALFLELIRIAHERNCGRMEWVCLDWNTPGHQFYRKLKANPLEQWVIYRLKEQQILEWTKE
ncbi:MAG: GNAT family N-acetyltransferase [Tissierellia bacterium]|nr:GNAT family N-acetyltransferase [Tissierellia bacterium]